MESPRGSISSDTKNKQAQSAPQQVTFGQIVDLDGNSVDKLKSPQKYTDFSNRNLYRDFLEQLIEALLEHLQESGPKRYKLSDSEFIYKTPFSVKFEDDYKPVIKKLGKIEYMTQNNTRVDTSKLI